MKKNYLLIFLTSVFLTACNPRENIVTFYLDNQLFEELVLNSIPSDFGSSTVYSEKPVDLLAIESFHKYFENILELDVKSMNISITDYEQSIEHPVIRIGNSITIENIPITNGSFEIKDAQLLQSIASELMRHQIVPFSFEANSLTHDSFKVSVTMKIQGVFAN